MNNGQFGEPETLFFDSNGLQALDEDDGCFPVDVTEISLGGINHESGDIIRTGTYQLDVEICQELYDPCIGVDTLLAVDGNQEGMGQLLIPMEVYAMTDGTNVIMHFNILPPIPTGVINIYYVVDSVIVQWWSFQPGQPIVFPLPPCCETGTYEILYEVYDSDNIGYNSGYVTLPFGDFYPATVKKFIDVYKLVEHPGEYTQDTVVDLYCEDFEDPCEINTNWATIDQPVWGANGALDTWTWSDKRYCSAGHSMHSTSFDEYLPNQHDILQMIVPVNVAPYDKVKVSFCMWVEGDAINIGNETVPIMLIQDYGYFEYSFDGVTWINPDGLYYDTNGVSKMVSFNITLNDASILDDNIFVRFVWKADAAFCYEGMYIDDVCFVGTIKGETITEPWDEWVWIHDSYDGPITFDEECITNVFPDVWVADEEGTYMICAWLEAIDECHYASTPVDDKYCIVIEVGDILDNELNCVSLDITPSSPAWEGDDITATIEVCNVGTLDETNKQVQMTVNRGSFQIVATDSFEGGTNQPDGVMLRMADSTVPLDDYPTDYVTNAEATRTYWHYTTYDASDGSTALANYHETGAQPWINPYAIFASDYVRGPILGTGNDIIPQGMSATYDIKANLGAATDRLMWGVIDVDTGWGSYYSLYGVQYWDWTEFEIEVSSWINDICTSSPAYFGFGDHFSLVWRLNKAAPGVGDPACPWNNEWKGMMIDNVNIISLVAEEEVIYQQTNIIPFLNITDCVTLTFDWPDAGVGQYVFSFEIITPDSNADNNKCIFAYNIINTIECIEDWECVDYTGPGQGHWVEESCCGGYFWPGDPATTMYGNNWDDCLYLKNATGGLNFNMVGTACIEFDTWYQISAGDFGFVEYSTDGGMVWWPLVSYTGTSVGDPFGWFHATLCLPSPGTATTQFRFRFDSNATGVNRGWFVDNIELTLNSATVFGPDPALTFTNFYRHEKQFGCWWTQPWIETYHYQMTGLWAYAGYESYFEPSWGCYDQGIFTSTYNVFNARPWLGAYPDNLNTAIIGTIDVPTAFYGWISATTYYDQLDTNDLGYIEVSRDGIAWDILGTKSGAYAPTNSLGFRLVNDYVYWDSTPAALGGSPAQYDVTDYLDVTQLHVRARFVSGPTNGLRMAGFGLLGPVCFYGMSDNNAPVTTAQMTGTFDEDCHWYTSCVKIKLDASDDISGVAHIYYTLDGVQYEYTQLVSICTDGTHTFCYWSVDNEGNVEEKKCLPEFRIDMTGPTVDITGPTPGLYLFGNKIMELKSGKTIFLFNGIPVTATATAADNPVEVVQFFLDDVLMAEDSTAPYSATLSAKHTGPATIKVVAIDGQGRTATDTLNIDNYFKLF